MSMYNCCIVALVNTNSLTIQQSSACKKNANESNRFKDTISYTDILHWKMFFFMCMTKETLNLNFIITMKMKNIKFY